MDKGRLAVDDAGAQGDVLEGICTAWATTE